MRINKATLTATISFLFFFAGMSYGADAKIGIVDLQRVFEESSAGKSAKGELKKQFRKMEADMEKRKGEIEKLKQNFEKKRSVVNREKLEEMEREFKIKVMDFQALQKKYNEELKEHESILAKRFHKDIFKIIKEMGKKEGYTMIVDRAVVLYFTDLIDLTDVLIKKYNAKYSK